MELNGRIWSREAGSLSEAKDYFVRLKDLPEEEFNKLFVVIAKPREEGNETR